MQIPVIIVDHQGCKTMLDWIRVLAVVENNQHDSVTVRFDIGPVHMYYLEFGMSLDEFNKQVDEQLKPPIPDTFWAEKSSSNVTITPLSSEGTGLPFEGIET